MRERKRSREKGRTVEKKNRVTERKEERKEGSYIERVLGSKIKWLFIPRLLIAKDAIIK